MENEMVDKKFWVTVRTADWEVVTKMIVVN